MKASTLHSFTYERNRTPGAIYVLCTTMESSHHFLLCIQLTLFEKMVEVILYRSQNSKINFLHYVLYLSYRTQ